MRRTWGGLTIISAVLMFGFAGLWIWSSVAAQVVQHVRITPSQKLINYIIAHDNRLVWRNESAIPQWQSLPAGWHYFQLEGYAPVLDVPPYEGTGGFEAAERYYGNGRMSTESIRVVRFSVPMWFLVLLFGLAPGYWLTHRPVHPGGHCQSCGYDMRETPDRCPECGECPAS